MDLTTGIVVTLIIGAGIYFAYWATQRVMKENKDSHVQRARKRSRKR